MSGPAPSWLSWLTGPAAGLYGVAVSWRNRRYDRRGPRGRAEVPVVSVGNITVGGVGKSPFTAWLAETLRARGRRPAIALRGYRGGDEAAEHAARAPRVPVLVGPRRQVVIETALVRGDDIDCVVLDDGFQHRQLHRDLDIVLVDASRPDHLRRLLPAGWLREPASSLRRADAVVITHAGSAAEDEVAAWVRHWHGGPPLGRCRHAWRELELHDGAPAPRIEPVAWLAGRRVVTLLGVGHPGAVRSQLRAAGADVVADVPLADHAPITAGVLGAVERAAGGADAVVMTGKDWVKAAGVIDFSRWSVPIVVPRLVLHWCAGRDALLELVERALRPAGRTIDAPVA